VGLGRAEVVAIVTAVDDDALAPLRSAVPEGLVLLLQRQHPDALPRGAQENPFAHSRIDRRRHLRADYVARRGA
jgi:hypothetical protein